MSTALTARQSQVLAVIEAYLVAHGYPPSVREIAEALGAHSTATAQYHLVALERKGYLERRPNSPRAMRVVRG